MLLNDSLNGIVGVKRNYCIAASVAVLFSLLLLIGGINGARTIISFVANAGILLAI